MTKLAEARLPADNPASIGTHTTGTHTADAHASDPHHIDEHKLAELIDRHFTPQMRREINEMLAPGGQPPNVIQRGDTLILDTSDRFSTVMVGFIDEEAGLVVTDFTSPLPVDDNE